MSAGYARVLELARRERELMEGGRWEEVVALLEEREAAIAELPAEAPPEARDLLEESVLTIRSNAAALAAALEAARDELAHLSHARRALASYEPRGHEALLDARG